MSSAITLGGRWERKQITAVVCFAVCVLASVVLAVAGGEAGLWGLIPIVLYAVLALLGVDVVLATIGAVLVAAIMTRTAPVPLGQQLATSMGSLVAVIGLIILLGAGLGQVAQQTGAAQALVRTVMGRIGLSTPTRVQFGVMASSLVIVGALGTLAGGNAIIAPIVIPIAARMGWRPPAVAAMFHAAGAAGLMMGPFTPPVVTITAAAKLSYGEYFLKAGLPVGAVTIITGFFMARWIQKHTDQEYTAADAAEGAADAAPSAAGRRAAMTFVGVLVALAVYGVWMKAGYSYALVVMVVTAAATGLAGRLGPKATTEAVYAGASRLIWLFMLFWLLDPLLTLVEKTGAFATIFDALKPVMPEVGPFVFLLLVVGIGYVHAVPGAAVAQVVLINKLFSPLVASLGIPPAAWSVALLGTAQIDQLGPYPTADMMGQMGLARSSDLRMMLFNGWAIMAVNTVGFMVLFAVLL
ncbi:MULTISPECIES: TRAP transporter large permease subunit [Thermomonosporaceae]|uniref:TRAP transporter large permease subunit n=1 Tax=Thermomonosporaceae TaxID=2012 RepID=UPI00255B3AE9|nr:MULTISPECIES: TRAP transporter large permease subunit [Thermomonosporaceae]MDL4775785.1 TRAP transporter large permease subunit [Actinomadura xylanilytica]